MKKVVFITLTAVFTSILISCKNEVPSESLPKTTDLSEELALIDPIVNEENSEETYLYVTAYSGLSLREFDNLQSEKLARMPYGSKVRVISAEDNTTMTIGGIPGGMNEIAFNHKKGFAFNGYLSKYFPPELDITPQGYAKELMAVHPEIGFTKEIGGTASNPSNTVTLTIPGAEWHEAYFIAQRLFDFPKEFEYPNPKGKDHQSIVDSKPKKGIWTSEMEITRKDNTFEKISYKYISSKYSSLVTITNVGDSMVITKTEEIQ